MSITTRAESKPTTDDPNVRVRYMGNKHELAGDVATIVADLGEGKPFLDLFCGMCSVGSAIAASGRPVWGNDVQWSASTVAKCLLTSVDEPVGSDCLEVILEPDYLVNLSALERRFQAAVRRERKLLLDPDLAAFAREDAAWKHVGNSPALRREARALSKHRQAPYRLFTITFAWGYFGLWQAMQIDSLRYAIDRAKARRVLSPDQARWALLSLMQAASCIASTPGHFAQYLGARTEAGLTRVVSQRRRDAWNQFLGEADAVRPLGTAVWRAGNRVMRRNALVIWPELARRGYRDGVIYADPPYSKDHYSRYYHVLDTLVRYDYPDALGKGRYRADRFVTPFSLATQVASSFDRLARGVASTHSTLILSYPSNGLLSCRKDGDLDALLRRHFSSVRLVLRRPTLHSTLGGRHGAQTSSTEELIYVAGPTS